MIFLIWINQTLDFAYSFVLFTILSSFEKVSLITYSMETHFQLSNKYTLINIWDILKGLANHSLWLVKFFTFSFIYISLINKTIFRLPSLVNLERFYLWRVKANAEMNFYQL